MKSQGLSQHSYQLHPAQVERRAAERRPTGPTGAVFLQLNFDELDEPLRTTTFVVVDLETTGGAAGADSITEIGAVKVCNGEVIGEFATLVDPGAPISPFISVLTGITDRMVSQA